MKDERLVARDIAESIDTLKKFAYAHIEHIQI